MSKKGSEVVAGSHDFKVDEVGSLRINTLSPRYSGAISIHLKLSESNEDYQVVGIDNLITSFENSNLKQKMLEGCTLVIYGGESLKQESKIIRLLEEMDKRWEFTPVTIIETRGTVIPNPKLYKEYDVIFNVNPQLSNQTENFGENVYFEEVLDHLASNNLKFDRDFVFDVENEKDLSEVEVKYIDKLDLSLGDFWIRPLCEDLDTLLTLGPKIANICADKGYNFFINSRIVMYGKK